MIEPVFADTQYNRCCDRLQRRGIGAVGMATDPSHPRNLLKLWRHTITPAAA